MPFMSDKSPFKARYYHLLIEIIILCVRALKRAKLVTTSIKQRIT